MRRDVEPSAQMKQLRKRERESDSETTEPASKQRRSESSPTAAQQEEPLLPTPARSAASPKQHVDPSSQPSQTLPEPVLEAPKQPSDALSKQGRPKRHLDETLCDPPLPKRRRRSAPAPELQPVELQQTKEQDNWFIDRWQKTTVQESALQEKGEGSDIPPLGVVEDSDIIPTAEILGDWEDEENDRMSQPQDAGGSQGPGSAVSERLRTSSPMYRGTLKMNGVILDDLGIDIPQDVNELVTRHIRKESKSPRLGDDEKVGILRKVQLVWNSPESRVTDIMALPMLPFGDLEKSPSLAQGGDILWTRTPLPRNDDYPLVTPKTDKHLGFQTTLGSQWTPEELTAADHPRIRPYSQPTRENLFPSFLAEAKSEATGGTAYAAEAQLATAGCHRVNSMIWILDQIDPERTRKSSDAIVFSAVFTQRQVIAHVHYYDYDKNSFCMSFIDSFYLAKDVQGCVDFGKNMEEWLVKIQQPVVREAMRGIYPVTKLWKKGRAPSALADDASSFISDGVTSAKSVRTE